MFYFFNNAWTTCSLRSTGFKCIFNRLHACTKFPNPSPGCGKGHFITTFNSMYVSINVHWYPSVESSTSLNVSPDFTLSQPYCLTTYEQVLCKCKFWVNYCVYMYSLLIESYDNGEHMQGLNFVFPLTIVLNNCQWRYFWSHHHTCLTLPAWETKTDTQANNVTSGILSKECRPWPDTMFCSIWSWSTLFANVPVQVLKITFFTQLSDITGTRIAQL